MGRELRRVPADWVHPKREDDSDRYQPMHDEPFAKRAEQWRSDLAKWEASGRAEWKAKYGDDIEFWEYDGNPPDRAYYRPNWPEESRTHFQMYEDTTEGTPISPVMADIESLAHWLADNNASAFAGQTATYEQWLAMCKAGSAVSAMYSPQTGMISGVAAITTLR